MALNAISNVFRIAELRTRLAYTVALLAVYRIGIFITTPGVDRAAMNAFMKSQEKEGTLVTLFNLVSGGALEQMSMFGLGIMPYVSSSIIRCNPRTWPSIASPCSSARLCAARAVTT